MFKKVPLLRALKHDRWVRPYLHHYRKTLILAISLGIITFICGGGLMFCAGFLISKSATHPENILLVYVPIVLTRAFGIARPAFRYVERLVSHNWVLKMTSRLRQKLYDSLEEDATIFNSKYQLGDILMTSTISKTSTCGRSSQCWSLGACLPSSSSPWGFFLP